MPARVRVERPREQASRPWALWFLATLPFASCGGILGVGNSCAVDFRRSWPHLPPEAFTVLLLWMGIIYLVSALFTGRLRWVYSWIAPPAPIEPEAQPELEQPTTPPLSEALYIGVSLAAHSKEPEPVYLTHETRNRHVYLIGKTRTGKTSVMKNMIEQDMRAGHGLCFIDPHGDAAEDLAGVVPEDRIDDVIYFDPTKDYAPSFNPFALQYQVAKLAEDVVSVFAMLVGDSWGPRLEHILRFAVMTLIADKRTNHTISDLKTMLIDEAFRGDVLSGIDNAQLLEFWAIEFPAMPNAATAPILNKLSAFLAPMSDLERVFSVKANNLDFTAIMDHGKILIVNLSKGVLGDEPSRLLGGLIVAGIQQAALARAVLPEAKRRPFYFYVDEFQNYTVSSFATILSESAKYKLNLTLAHQNFGQVPEYLRRAIFGNVATLIAYQVSAQDAPILTKEMHRSRIVVREKTSNQPLTLDQFVDQQTSIYTAAADDQLHGMSYADELRFTARYQIPSSAMNVGSQRRKAIKDQQAQEELRYRGQHIKRVLSIFESDVIDVGALSSLFPDFAFKDLGYPTVEDFVNLPPHHGYVRMGTAQNVRPFAPPMPMEPNREIQRTILDRQWNTVDSPTLETSTTPDEDSADAFITGAYDDES